MPQAEQHRKDDYEKELSRLRKQFRHLVDSLPIGIIIVGENDTIEGVNPTITRLFGYDGRELVGQNVAMLIWNAPWIRGGLKEWYSLHPNRAVELEGVSKEQDLFPVDVTVNQLLSDIQERLVVVIQDVTERFLANKLKQDFFRMISHDIRSPLTNVVIFLEMIGSGHQVGSLTEFGQSKLATAQMNIERILHLVSGLLELDRLESSVGNLAKQPVSLTELVATCVAGVTEVAAAKDICIDRVVDNVVVEGDIVRLEQVLINLLSNAIGHSAPGKPIELRGKQSSQSVRISIRDHGPGVPDEEKPLIFERFKQGSTKKAGGYGLGLAICKEIVRQHGGSIGCEDAPGGGSIFWFELRSSTVNQQTQK